jgi:RNA polymerase sigma-54 factor
MTPQLQQAIKLLQLSNLELTAYVEAELERNPLLERDEAGDDGPVPAPDGPPEPEPLAEPSMTAGADQWIEETRSAGAAASELDTDSENVFPDAGRSDLAGAPDVGSWASVRQTSNAIDEEPNLEAYVAEQVSLKDHLLSQMPMVLADPVQQLIGRGLIDLVNEAGYLTGSIDEMAEKLGAPVELAETVLAKLQTLDPPGVMARSLAECLALQLKDRNRYDPVIARLLDNLPLLAAHDFRALRRAVGIDADELAEMIGEIKGLNPKPGLKFGSEPVQPVVPDVIVRPASDGGWIVELNAETLPRVLVNRSYLTRVSKLARASTDKDYLHDCLQTANWLVKSLDQRARTILRVAEEIVRQQDGFFAHGVQHLRPLNLKTVADAIKMHESTVSRVTSNKYIATPRGILELKFFFTSAIASASGEGEAHSSEAVRHRIRQLIEAESGERVLSDDRIVEILRDDGIDIARRTVAKYREAMRIPSSVQRRREKRLVERTARIA